MINTNLIIIIIIILLCHFGNKITEHFQVQSREIDYYPVSYQKNISINNTVPGAMSLNNYGFKNLINIIKQVKKNGNKGIIPLKFNQQFLPIKRSIIGKDKIEPIIEYIVSSINKIGAGFNKIKLDKVKNICKEETDIDVRITFDLHCKYFKKLNIYHYMNRRVNVFGEKIDKNTFKISDLVLRCVIISSKALVDDIFVNQVNNIDKIYIDKLYILGLMNDDYLPGSQVSDFWKYYNTDVPFSNKIIDERYIANKIKKNKREVNNLTKELDTSII